MGHVQLRPVPVPVGTISAPLTRVIAFVDAHAIGLSCLVEAIGREDEKRAKVGDALRGGISWRCRVAAILSRERDMPHVRRYHHQAPRSIGI